MREVKDCAVAVLGGCGFVGGYVVRELLSRNCTVVAVDNLCVGRLDILPDDPRVKFVHHDITGSEDRMRSIFLQNKVRFVVNMVAVPYVVDSYSRPLHTLMVNSVGAMKAINAAQEAGVEAIVQVSSAEIYGRGDNGLPMDEEATVAPHSTYSATKACIDFMVQTRWREAQTPAIAVRLYNCLGRNDFFHPYIVPTVVKQLLAEKKSIRDNGSDMDTMQPPTVPVVRLGNNSRRAFLYAGDAAEALVLLLEKGAFGEVFNLGVEDSVQMYDLAQMIGKIMGYDFVRVVHDESRVRAWELWGLSADTSKLRQATGWVPRTSFQEALRLTVESLVANPEKFAW